MRTWQAAVAAVAIGLWACGGKPDTPSERAPGKESPQGAASGAPAESATVEEPPEPETPLSLPAGQTLGDLLPPVPPMPRRLTTGPLTGAATAQTDCGDVLPAGCALSKSIELTLPGAKADDPPQMAQVCLCMRTTDRPDSQRAASPGKQVVAVAVWPGDKRAEAVFAEAKYDAKTLPAARQKSGHDAAAWGALIATGWADVPVLAVASARFYDGQFGHEAVWNRSAQTLHVIDGQPAWKPLETRTYTSTDLEHLQALCDGAADWSPADRGGPNADACVLHDQLAADLAVAAAARLQTRQKRLKGQGTESPATDDDPQSIWVREARKQQKAGKWQDAITTALRADAICGEAATEAHAVLSDALRDGHVQPLKSQPAQPLTTLCEPLPDKAAPKRQRVGDDKGGKPAAKSPAKPTTKAGRPK